MNYNNSDTISYFTNASGNDCRAFASDIVTYGWNFAWTARFNFTTRFINSMTDVFQIEKDHTVAALNLLGAAKDAGYTIDYSGANIIDTNSGGGSHPNAGAFHVHTDWIVVNLPPPTVCLASFWIEHKAAA